MVAGSPSLIGDGPDLAPAAPDEREYVARAPRFELREISHEDSGEGAAPEVVGRGAAAVESATLAGSDRSPAESASEAPSTEEAAAEGHESQAALPPLDQVRRYTEDFVGEFAGELGKVGLSAEAATATTEWFYETMRAGAKVDGVQRTHNYPLSGERDFNLSGRPADLLTSYLNHAYERQIPMGDVAATVNWYFERESRGPLIQPRAPVAPAPPPPTTVDARLEELNNWMAAPKGSPEYAKYWKDEKVQAEYRDLLRARSADNDE
jgi:hypothetical protein